MDLTSLIGKLNQQCRKALEGAAALCVSQTHYNVEIEHFLVKLLEDNNTDLLAILKYFDVNPAIVSGELSAAMDRFQRGNGRTPAVSPHLSRLIEAAWMQASLTMNEATIRSAAVMLAILTDDSLRGLMMESSLTLLRVRSETLRESVRDIVAGSAEARADGSMASGALPRKPNAKPSDTPNLDQYTVDLTALAADGKLDPALGRDAEIRQVVDILLRRRQNNPILTGEAGVGKTAVVEGFAQRIAAGDVPPLLRNASVRTLDIALLQAGAGVKGEFENRLKAVISEVKASPRPVIVFIDEAHTIIGAGGQAGQGDAANLLKPALARGELRTIAATTWAEYKKYFEKDPALTRRFQVVKVEEPNEEAATAMLRSVVDKLEWHHNVRIRDEAVRDAVSLSHRYLPERRLPDKAVSVLDTACARVAIGQRGTPPAVEEARRTVDNLSVELRVAKREQLTGSGSEPLIEDLTKQLARAKVDLSELEGRWKEEAHAVREILRVHEELDALLEADQPNDGERSRLNDVLARLTNGLEAIQADTVMVPTEVTSEVVAAVISNWTGIPVGRMMTDEIHSVLNLRARLEDRVVGQSEALETIVKRIRTYRAGLDDPGKPVGVFLLAGPSGVGKTETALAIAEALFGGERNLITINMSEFQEAHTVSSLKGAPPGYVGYGTGGVLTEAVRRRPYSVVLLDEVEKAHPDVMELFYQVFDKGSLEDGEGVAVDFKNTVILLTTNLGSDTIMRASRAGEQRPAAADLTAAIRRELVARFKPALLGRMVVVPYMPLRDAEIRDIVGLKIAKIQRRIKDEHGASLTVAPEVFDLIAQRCTEVDTGARNVDHIVTHSMLPPLSSHVLELLARGDKLASVHVDMDDRGEFVFEIHAVGPHPSLPGRRLSTPAAAPRVPA
jgi:type VI secretion system protein VasG